MDYNFQEIEKKWQDYWKENQAFKVENDSSKPKYYVLDMFPYPSGAGLHVGHPLGYIASDIVSRYKNNKGFNVLHPMGFDAFGLPAEQYAIQTGQHPAVTTEKNLARYKEQLTQIGFSFDWSREVQTCDPKYYKWTQWIFMQLFQHYYDNSTDKAEPIEKLVAEFEQNGNGKVDSVCDEDTEIFSANEWKEFSEKEQSDILLKYRLTFLAEATVNWCPALGTVLANDEVKDGVSERGGHPVERKKMKQWMMRITAYAERLLNGLDNIDWPEPMKEMQRNWIGKSYGAEVTFNVEDKDIPLKVFTTRPDTLYGVTYMSIAPEHELVEELTTDDQRTAVESYVEEAKNRSERDRMSDTKTVSGVFTGSYAIHPITGDKVPIWIADYVLAGYGTGIVMAVPSSDTRDYAFATHFDLPIIQVQEGPKTDITQEDFDPKAGTMVNSDFLNGLSVPDAITKINNYLEENGLGKARVNFRMRDAVFSRQRYWGEPVPVYFKNDIPYLLDESELPLVLPSVDAYLPTEQGDPPLGRATDWKPKDGDHYELSTMPGWAGSSWYFLRYMDPDNDERLVSAEAEQYWNQVDLYIGGSEHATGHLLYSRFWNKFLKDIGYVSSEEPFKKLVNQGMIQGMSAIVYRLTGMFVHNDFELNHEHDLTSEIPPLYITLDAVKNASRKDKTNKEFDRINSYIQQRKDIKEKITNKLLEKYPELSGSVEYSDIYSKISVDINFVNKDDELDIDKFKGWRKENKDAEFIFENGKFICDREIEKMSKSKYNVVNPDDIIADYGADTLRMYEMFLGPLETAKPWDTKGIDGVFRFLRKFWALSHDGNSNFAISDDPANEDALKVLHKTIKKVEEDINRLSFNTAVSAFMICVNELSSLKCNNREVIEQLTITLSPFAPHICEELWALLGHTESILKAPFPKWEEKYVVENAHEYPISINGKMRTKIKFPVDMGKDEIEKQVLADEAIQKWLEGKSPKKVIVVPNKIVNLVV